MSIEYPCVYWSDGMCKKFSDDKVTSFCVEGPCGDQMPSNADKIRAMSDEELAKYLYQMQKNILRYVATVIGYSEEFDFADEAPDLLEWLQQPAETEGKK